MAQGKVCNVLFLCTGNSARSILAEALLNALGNSRFRAHSAGSHPVGRVNPLALEVLAQSGLSTEGLHSKGWQEFAGPGAPPLDIVITVCDNARGEACPIWPGHPVSAHWGVEDPAAAPGTIESRRQAFADVYAKLRDRVARLVRLPVEQLDRPALKERLDEIGRA